MNSMCGIAGWFSSSPVSEPLSAPVARMVAAMRHRGPDDSGVAEVSSAPLCVLGQSRLAIIDLSPDARQPMTDPDTGNVIVFNGEIYNFKQLRAELEAAGQRFVTRSDTEVILKAFAAWGESCCRRLRGIFAFAIWNRARRELFFARDPLGVKPFYYCRPGDGLAFASEVRALLAAKAAEPRLDRAGLDSYLAYGSVQEPLTLIEGIVSLPPAHCGTFASGAFRTRRYWSPVGPAEAAREPEITTREAAGEAVCAALREAVGLQMISDVPLGAFLSGGIDSSAVVSLMRQADAGPVRTFSIVFDVPEFDERRYAKAVAEQNGTGHVELELTGAMAKAQLGRALDAFDQPSMDGLNTWFVSKLVKNAGLTVALSGVGGDELFIGYGGFAKPLAMDRWQRRIGGLPAALGRAIASAARSERMRKFGQMMGYPLPAYFLSRQVFAPEQIARLLRPEVHSDHGAWTSTAFGTVLADGAGRDPLDQISIYELGTYMLSTLLRDTDQMSMAHSLEVRVPLIDPEVVRLLLRIPGSWKTDPATPKPLLVQAAGDGLPPHCVHRPKRGFTLPFEAWFKGAMRPDVDHFCHGGASPVFDPRGLAALWRAYEAGSVAWSRIWGLFVLNHWLIHHGITVR